MSYQVVGSNTTICPDTPANHREFERLKASLTKRPGASRLTRQIAAENQWLRALRCYLPGREPDR